MQKKNPQNNHTKSKDIIGRKRTLSRLMAAQIIYQYDFYKGNSELFTIKDEVIDNYILEAEDEIKSYRDKIDENFIQDLISQIKEKTAQLDLEISEFVKNATINDLPAPLLQIFRLAAFELKYKIEIPLKVLINEYVDIAACFFDKSKVMFANSLLENLAKKYRQIEFETIKQQ